ncbi:MarR family winged helix-turn-helix transcriptional regulator [Mucilaginibacter sp. FT3.2]|uniref:MarR family winged helix-turn-helix transcriptional regulator n=1 Tax=Mucilaginibacter sp. FT3.2 TaxID=2723090 RepID=UPI00161B5798|nr:MarR family transcriptional regulator [Mucilaginibacter sp. FT3.2]MBB6229840.1 DNA-binding MarR family transcriptional regulator [Mucilaginibacter sp. FT3.2]
METKQKAELVGEFCHSIFELRYKLRKIFQAKLKEANLNISFEVLEVIKILLRQDGINQQELADELFKDKSNITYLIDNMVKSGLVTRKEDEADRRNKLIILTEKAHELRKQLDPLARYCYLAMAEQVSTQQINSGMELLFKMNSSLASFSDI